MRSNTRHDYARRLGLLIKQGRLNHPDYTLRTQAEFAEMVWVNKVYLAGLETGTRMPGLQILVAISQTISITMAELFGRAEGLGNE